MFGASSFAPSDKRRNLPILRGLMNMPKFRPFDLLNENRGVFGINLGHLWHEIERLGVVFHEVMNEVGEGRLVPVIDREFRFEEAAAAHAYMQGRNNFGKVLLVTR
jgi:NADPH:quinone reductase-like Zn-dependent oxidoreductase